MNRIALILGIGALAALASAHQESQFHPELPTPKRSTTINEPEVLKGLPGVGVLVEATGADEKAIGVTQETLTDILESSLQHNGIEILSPSDRLATRGRPRLYLNVNVLQGAYSISLRVDEMVRPENSPRTIIGGATVWEKSTLGFHGGSALPIRKHIEKMVDAFAQDYREVNPKK
ncbi:MAG: hypothetical protein QM758_05105 [Armatimonas sp.]